MKKICLLMISLFVPSLHAQTPTSNAPPALSTVAAPPAMTTVAPSPPATPLPNTCFCLHDPATDNVIRNCEWQKRKNDPQPRALCADADGIMQPQGNIQGWTVLSADDAGCAPCKDNSVPGQPGIPRSGDEES